MGVIKSKDNLFEEFATIKNYSNKEEWHELRDGYIGGSDAGVILATNPYKNKRTLWLEKKKIVAPPDLSNNRAVQKGVKMESLLIEMLSIEKAEMYDIITQDVTYYSKEHPFMLANLDGILRNIETGELVGLEIKTANASRIKDWEQIPMHYYCQIQHYMAVTGLKKFILYAYIKTPFCTYLKTFVEDRNENDINLLIEQEKEFYELLQGEKAPNMSLVLRIFKKENR